MHHTVGAPMNNRFVYFAQTIKECTDVTFNKSPPFSRWNG
ncbi:hypothetical protein RB2083_416 [Rhodobacteraceae bacterium HTCC2083]|nr:hypothetical protein RB2083_416 [Rhodobacteraceae bacterium HTCC2083]